MKTEREYNFQYCSCFQVTCPQVAKSLPSVKHEMKCQDAIFDWHRQQEADLYPLAKLHADSERLLVMTQTVPHCLDKESTFPVDCEKSASFGLHFLLKSDIYFIFKLTINGCTISVIQQRRMKRTTNGSQENICFSSTSISSTFPSPPGN